MMKNLLKIAFGLIMAICFGQNVGAEETDSPLFVREDCIWEYEYYAGSPMMADISYYFFRYKFEGTEEINGKTYHKLKHFHTTHWCVDGVSPNVGEVTETDEDNTVALIREEDGKVWMHNSENPILVQIEGENEYWYEVEPVEGVEEIMLYDFNVKAGDRISVWAHNPYPLQYGSCFFQTEFDIKDITELNGKKCYNADFGYNLRLERYGEFKYVEGVGAIGNSTILGPEVALFGVDDASRYEWTFNNQYDLDGNVIFAGKGNKPPTPTDSPLFVREDCIWEYYKLETMPQGLEDIVELSKYRFDGTKEIEGKQYNILKKFHTTRWHADHKGPYQLEEEDTDVIIGYLREANGRVMMYNSLPVVTELIGKWNDEYNMYDYTESEVEYLKEILLYDFIAPKDESFYVWCLVLPFDEDMLTKYMSTGIIEENGTEIFTSVSCYPPSLGVNDFPVDFRYVAGTGNIGAGTILGPELHLDIAVGGPLEENAFNNQYDLNGNVIFAGKGVNVPEIGHVSTVNSDNKRDRRMYDLMGREIKNPLPGTIYIQNGHKLIAR